jgi:hypothetical protein
MIRLYAERAEIEAALRIGLMREGEDRDGMVIWDCIRQAIVEIEAMPSRAR